MSKRSKLFRYLPVVMWTGVIFFLSTSQGSMSKTSFIVGSILRFLFPTAGETDIISYQFYVRKLAHLTEYGILGLLSSRALSSSTKTFLRSWWFVIASVVVLAVAATDEFNQSFNPLRTGTPYDVLIDLTGGTIGILLFFGFRRSCGRRRSN